MDNVNENQQIIETAVNFFSSVNLCTTGILATPRTPTNLCVVLCHGFLSDKQSRTNRRLTELLIPQGIATFRFDWFGMGETQKHFSNLSLKQCESQLDAAFHVLHERGLNRLGLVGSSFGGFLSILSAPKLHGLHALGLKCPVVDFAESLRLEFGQTGMAKWKSTNYIPNIIGDGLPIPLHYGFYEECLTYDAYTVLPHIQMPTLIVHGDQDELIPRPQIDRLLATLTTTKRLKLIEGAGHQFGQPEEFRLMSNHLAKWMVQYLTNSR